MAKPSFKFSGLRQLLSELGFKEVPVKRPFIGFEHEKSNFFIVLPPYRNNVSVAPHHLAYVRMMLDGKGLMNGDEFDEIVANGPTRNSASS